jgi:hypothetical protein
VESQEAMLKDFEGELDRLLQLTVDNDNAWLYRRNFYIHLHHATITEVTADLRVYKHFINPTFSELF